MKIYLSVDMEGVAGVVDWSQVTPGSATYPATCALLIEEVNAALEGAAEAGADEFVVNDAHSAMANLAPDALAGRARLISGRYKPMYMMEGLDDTFAAVFLIGYHGSIGAASAVLPHTYSTAAIAEVWIDGVATGEAGVNALVADALGVPVALVTGDRTTARETELFCPQARAAVVKESISGFAAESLHPADARDLIRAEARGAVAGLATLPPRAAPSPATLGVRLTSADYAELACRIAGVRRAGSREIEITDSPLALYQTFVTILYLCRGLRP